MARPSYVELPSLDVSAGKAFYAEAFGWELNDYGPTYAATTTGDIDVGLQGDAEEAAMAPLVAIRVEDLDAALASVTGAGGVLTKPPFPFPGGRRFHFKDPNGNELAVFQDEA